MSGDGRRHDYTREEFGVLGAIDGGRYVIVDNQSPLVRTLRENAEILKMTFGLERDAPGQLKIRSDVVDACVKHMNTFEWATDEEIAEYEAMAAKFSKSSNGS